MRAKSLRTSAHFYLTCILNIINHFTANLMLCQHNLCNLSLEPQEHDHVSFATSQIDAKLDRQVIRIDGVVREKRQNAQVNDLNSYTILQGFAPELKWSLVQESVHINELNRAMGALVGSRMHKSLLTKHKFVY